jgi:hypothetical protein
MNSIMSAKKRYEVSLGSVQGWFRLERLGLGLCGLV